MEQDSALTIFDLLVYAGVGVTLIGLGLLIWCITRVARARRSGLSDADLRAAIQRVVPWNLAALALSTMGLMLVVIGVFMA